MVTNPLEYVFPIIVQTVEDWKSKNTPEQIKRTILSKLEHAQTQIVMKLLGFDTNTFSDRGSWELDHCNGRSGNSAAGDYLRSHSADAIKEWLSTVAMPKLTPKQEEELRKEFAREYMRLFKDSIRSRAAHLVSEDANKMLKDLFQEDLAAKYLEMQKLITPPSNASNST